MFDANEMERQIKSYQDAFGSLKTIISSLKDAKYGDIIYIKYPIEVDSVGGITSGGVIAGKLADRKSSIYFDTERQDACISVQLNKIVKISDSPPIPLSDIVKNKKMYSKYASEYEILFGKAAERLLESDCPEVLKIFKD